MSVQQGERIWEGRGEALAEARLSTADGRMADDLRLKGTHFRVLAHIGRQNSGRGWLRVSQTELAERWDMHRNSVNRACTELVEWGYLLQRTQEVAGESFCQYKICLDGDHPVGVVREASDGGSAQCSVHPSEGGECTAECAPVHSGSVQGCTVETAPPVYISTDKPTDSDSPPLPPAGGRGSEVDATSKLEERQPDTKPVIDWGLRWARGWTHAGRDAVIALLANPDTQPVAAVLLDRVRGNLRPAKAADPVAYVAELARRLAGTPADVLERAADEILDERDEFMPSAKAVSEIVDRARTALLRDTEAAMRRAVAASEVRPDAALTARWPAVRARLVLALGEPVVAGWLDGAILHSLANGTLRVVVENAMRQAWVMNNHAGVLLAAAQAEIAGVVRLDVITPAKLGRAA